MEMKQTLSTAWRYGRWLLVGLFFLYALLVAWRYQALVERDKIDADVAAIHANKLTREDVFGDLPPEPDPAENNATLAGVDWNNNGIRDDVERAIYFKYQNSAKEAAPAFQYAKALQMEFTHVYNSPTLVAVIQEESRGSLCLLDDNRISEVEKLVFNTEPRKEAQKEIYRKYMTSYKLPNDGCDLDPASL